MKKLLLFSLLLSTSFLVSCTKPHHIEPQQIYGTWGCETKYEDIGSATKDIIEMKPDGHFRMSGLIFDHTLEKLANKKIDNYFFSSFSYRTDSEGAWQLKGNALTYENAKDKVTRALSPGAMAILLKSPELRALEQKLFDIYSRKEGPKENKIELIIKRLDENGFTTEQVFDKSKNISVCKRLMSKEDEIEFFFPPNKN